MGRRLKNITSSEVDEWCKARMEHGRKKYGDGHLKRYNFVDVMEELLDAINILDLLEDRMGILGRTATNSKKERIRRRLSDLDYWIDGAMGELCEIDELLADEDCTDECGGQRIWWDGEEE